MQYLVEIGEHYVEVLDTAAAARALVAQATAAGDPVAVYELYEIMQADGDATWATGDRVDLDHWLTP